MNSGTGGEPILTFFIAIVFGWWFFATAKKQEGRNPRVWAAIGYFTFLAAATASSWGLQLLFLTRIPFSGASEVLRYAAAISIIVMAMVMGAAVTALVWRLCLQRRPAGWDGQRAVQNVAHRRSLAMPGPFPWEFALANMTVGLLQILITEVTVSLVWTQGEIPGGMQQLLFREFSVVVQAAGLAAILWTCRSWIVICLLWAALTPVITFGYYLLNSYLDGFLLVPPFMAFLSVYASALIGVAIIVLAVRQWGASLAVLLTSSLLSTVLGLIPFLVLETAKLSAGYIGLTVTSATVGGILFAFVLYAGLYFHEESRVPVEEAA